MLSSSLALAPAAPRSTAVPTRAAVLRRCACGGTPAAGGECAECRRNRLRRSASAAGPGFAPPVVHDVLRGPGAALDGATRGFMEPRFGHSFADVRVHADAPAAASAAAVGAHAYAVGRDLVFGAGRYAPTSADGRRLIAHELAHVVQQRGSDSTLSPRLEIGPVDAPEEREADAAAQAVAAGKPAEVGAAPAARLARSPRGGTGELHERAAAEWRRQHGLPESGVDEQGHPVGPTTAQLAYDPEAREPLRPACPLPDNNRGLYCILADRADDNEPRTCRTSAAHEAILSAARAAGRDRVASALDRMTRAGPRGASHDLIAQQAGRSFAGAPPAWERIVSQLGAVRGLLAGSSVRIRVASCEDFTCWSGGTMAHVRGAGDSEIFVCLRSFATESRQHLPTTLVHEAAHLAGVVTRDIRLEGYCDDQPCGGQCQPPDNAAAWAHFVDCIGGPMLTPRTDFNREMTRDVEGL